MDQKSPIIIYIYIYIYILYKIVLFQHAMQGCRCGAMVLKMAPVKNL